MKIFDAHCHLPIGNADFDLKTIKKNIIFNDIDSYRNEKEKLISSDVISLIFDYKNNFDFLVNELDSGKIKAIKIHNRIQKTSNDNFKDLLSHLKKINPSLPIIIDSFFYGNELNFQPSLEQTIEIATSFSNNPIIIAHCGGHKVLEYFLHLRTLKNVYYDLSFSLVYLKNTSVFKDYLNLIKYTDKNKILFGTDFPHVSGELQLEIFNEICTELSLKDESRENMLYNNSNNLFS